MYVIYCFAFVKKRSDGKKILSNGPKYHITRSFLSSWKGIFKMPKPSGEKIRKDFVIIGKVLFSSDLLFSKDYILLLKITLKWLLITQGKYVPLLIHLHAMHLLTVLRCIGDILFEKVCENIAKNDYLGHLDHGSFWHLFFFRCWLLSIIFWSMS